MLEIGRDRLVSNITMCNSSVYSHCYSQFLKYKKNSMLIELNLTDLNHVISSY